MHGHPRRQCKAHHNTVRAKSTVTTGLEKSVFHKCRECSLIFVVVKEASITRSLGMTLISCFRHFSLTGSVLGAGSLKMLMSLCLRDVEQSNQIKIYLP